EGTAEDIDGSERWNGPSTHSTHAQQGIHCYCRVRHKEICGRGIKITAVIHAEGHIERVDVQHARPEEKISQEQRTVTGSRSLALGQTDGVGENIHSEIAEIGDAGGAVTAAGLIGSVTDSEGPNATDTVAASQGESRGREGISRTHRARLLFAAHQN